MMKIRTIAAYLVSLTLLVPYYVAESIEPLSTAELASHCSHYAKEPNGVDAVFCVRYIQGFIDGAIATDEKVAQNAISEIKNEETFSERAMRQRKARTKSSDPTYYAEFCLGTKLSLKSVAEKIILSLNDRKHNPKELPARDAVYHILRKEYPCKKDGAK